ncbi:tyrosine-type recombinase/integrase [Oleidesulfovibrio alaskensis]|jgi:integrase|uniref:tyrosine-type recombinase/integrase n=1 Tax=Oleidesulfovibrio alaskensis TaxID=58180 RepID=UPI0004265FA7|nr:site-specific integrase [Oleidesulfovibrio alaskensis]
MSGRRAFTDDEVRRMRRAVPAGRFAARNLAAFELMIHTGGRASEVCKLQLRDVSRRGQMLDSVTFERRNTKGQRRGRNLPMHPNLRRALEAWQRELFSLGYFEPEAYLLQSQKGIHSNTHITPQHLWYIVETAAKRAGVLGAIGTHSCRKYFAQHLYNTYKQLRAQGRPMEDPLRASQLALGHSRMDSTLHYMEDVIARAEVYDVLLKMGFAA